MFKNLLVVFGLLDLISLFMTFRLGLKLLDEIVNPAGLPIFWIIYHVFEVVLIASLLISGILSILKSKSSLIVFYIQFPFKFAFMILSFGFFLKMFGIPYDSMIYKFMAFTVMTLEIARLAITIRIHRKYYKPR
jgi:hypothetical protein